MHSLEQLFPALYLGELIVSSCSVQTANRHKMQPILTLNGLWNLSELKELIFTYLLLISFLLVRLQNVKSRYILMWLNEISARCNSVL